MEFVVLPECLDHVFIKRHNPDIGMACAEVPPETPELRIYMGFVNACKKLFVIPGIPLDKIVNQVFVYLHFCRVLIKQLEENIGFFYFTCLSAQETFVFPALV